MPTRDFTRVELLATSKNKHPLRPRSGQAAFTLVELLVVVTIIVILISLLLPAMDKAVTMAERAKCLANQRTIVVGCQMYAVQNKSYFPVYTMPGIGRCSGWDLRTVYDDGSVNGIGGVKSPMGVGLLVVQGQLPATKLGKVIHCPTMNTMNIPTGSKGHNMDVIHGSGRGGSWWVDASYTARIIPGFNYRAASFYQKGEKTPTGRTVGGHLRTSKMGHNLIISVDTMDYRVGIRFVHLDGYNRVFADGHGSFFPDPNQEVEAIIANRNVDGTSNPALDEDLYDHMAVDP